MRFYSPTAELIIKELRGKLSPYEKIELEKIRERSPEQRELQKNLGNRDLIMVQLARIGKINQKKALEKFRKQAGIKAL